MNSKDLIQQYYKSFKDNDRKKLEEILIQDFKFMSNWANYDSAKEMLDTIWPKVIQNENEVSELEIYKLGNEFIVTYKLVTPDIIPMVEHITIRDQKITEIRVFTKSKN